VLQPSYEKYILGKGLLSREISAQERFVGKVSLARIGFWEKFSSWEMFSVQRKVSGKSYFTGKERERNLCPGRVSVKSLSDVICCLDWI
jgi:hypothetical protein